MEKRFRHKTKNPIAQELAGRMKRYRYLLDQSNADQNMQVGWRLCTERERLRHDLEQALDKYLAAAHEIFANSRAIDSVRFLTALQEARVRLRDHYQQCRCDPAQIRKGGVA